MYLWVSKEWEQALNTAEKLATTFAIMLESKNNHYLDHLSDEKRESAELLKETVDKLFKKIEANGEK